MKIFSFKSDIIPMSNDKTSKSYGKNHVTSVSTVDNKYPNYPLLSATNSKFIFKGFNLFILILSGGFLGYLI